MKAMTQTNMFGTKMGAGTSMISAIVAWLPHIETALRIGASFVAIVAGLYAILNYHADYKRKQKHEEKQHPKDDTRTGSSGHGRRRLHDD